MESIHYPFQRPSIRYPRETPSSDEEQEESPSYHTPTEEPDDDTIPHLSLAECDTTRNFGPGSEPDPTDATNDEGQGTSLQRE